MIAAPSLGFVFLATPKCASTSIETALRPHAEVILTGQPRFKHTNYRSFHKYIRPLLESKGFEPSSYEVVCLFREPLDWVSSWWRYRSRDVLADPSAKRHRNYAGDLSLEAFVKGYIARDVPSARIGRQARFVSSGDGTPGPDRIYRLDDLPRFVEFLNERVGTTLELGMSNVSPPRADELSEATRESLRQHLAEEYDIYENRTFGHA